jgi:hypothetical protein
VTLPHIFKRIRLQLARSKEFPLGTSIGTIAASAGSGKARMSKSDAWSTSPAAPSTPVGFSTTIPIAATTTRRAIASVRTRSRPESTCRSATMTGRCTRFRSRRCNRRPDGSAKPTDQWHHHGCRHQRDHHGRHDGKVQRTADHVPQQAEARPPPAARPCRTSGICRASTDRRRNASGKNRLFRRLFSGPCDPPGTTAVSAFSMRSAAVRALIHINTLIFNASIL